MRARRRFRTSLVLPLLLALIGLPAVGGCEEDPADAVDRSGVVVSGTLRHALVAGGTEEAATQTDGAGSSAPIGALAIVALGTNSETISVPLGSDGSFELPVAAGASYTLNVLDIQQDVFVASFLFRAGENVSSALGIGSTDVALGTCQLVSGEVWCENGFFDAPDAAGAVRPLEDMFGVVRLTLDPHPANLGLITELLGGTVVDIEIAPNPRNAFHVAMFNRAARGCDAPFFGVGEASGDDRFLYTQHTYVTDTCRATGRYHLTCTVNPDGDCVGFMRIDLASSGSDCSALPSVHLAERFRARLVEPDVLTCDLPPTCGSHDDCASRVCDVDVGFCAAEAPNEALRLYVFDVGNGQSVLAVSPTGTTVLLDAGRPNSGRLVTTMMRRLVNKLDYMVLSHFDADHAGGAVPVMLGPDGAPGRKGVDDDGDGDMDELDEAGAPDSDDLVPDVVLDRGLEPMPSGFEDYLAILGDRRRRPEPGESHDLGGGVTMTVLTANGHVVGGVDFDVDEENARSVGVLFRHGDFSFLNLGDLPGGSGMEAIEQAVLPALADVVPIDVHLASHHGSAASSSDEFIAALQPRVVVVSVGDSARCGPGYNGYGLPAQSVLDAFVAAGSVEGLYQTEAGGASFSGLCEVYDHQTYPRDYGDLQPVFTYSAFTISAYRETFRVEGLLIDDHYRATGCVRDDCPRCPEGYVEDPTDATRCVLDPCDPDPCGGRGICAAAGPGVFDCLCGGHWAGEACDRCADGYAGADCDACADGYLADPDDAGRCVDDPCDPDPCHGHGGCTVLAEATFSCACDDRWDGVACAECAAGYAGTDCDHCAAGFVPDPTAPGDCVADPCVPDPCHGHGACAVLGAGAFECACGLRWAGDTCDTCATGYTGEGCATCAAGFRPDPDHPDACVADPCDPDPCGGRGACSPVGADGFACACGPRFAGPACAECAAGYTGATCADCAAGHVPDAADPSRCVADPCAADPCGAHGTCAALDGDTFECDCAGRWAGPTCADCATGYAGATCEDCAAGHHAEAGGCVPDVGPITWCGLRGPAAAWTEPGEAVAVAAELLVDGATGAAGRLPGVTAQVCWGPAPLPALVTLDELDCAPAAFLADAGDRDAYGATVAPDGADTFAVVAGFSGDGGATWTVCDLDGPAAAPARPGLVHAFNVANGGLERWDEATGLPEGWTADGGVRVARVPAAGHGGDGAAAALTRDSTDNGETDFVGPEHPVVAGGRYTLGLWYLDDDPSARSTLVYTWYDADHAELDGPNYSYLYTRDDPDWQVVDREVAAPAGAAWVRVSTRVYSQSGGAATGGAVLLDDAFVRPVCDETACPACADGFAPDPAAPGTCRPEPCQPDPCHGRGACRPLDAAHFECACEPGWAGETCDRCADGYAGPDCQGCAADHHVEGDACVADVAALDECVVVPPGAFWTAPGEATTVRGRLRVDGGTEADGRLPGIAVRVCHGPAPLAAPLDLATLSCVDASFAGDDGAADTYAAALTFPTAGLHGVVLAVSGDGGATWRACDRAGLVEEGGPADPAEARCHNVPNGGFEQWDDVADLPTGWLADPDVGVSPVSIASHSGDRAVALARYSTVNGDTDVESPARAVVGGASYTLSVWYLDEDPSARGTLIYTWYDAAHQALGASNYTYVYSDDGPDWQTITRTVTAPVDAAFVRVGTRVYGQSGGAPTGGVVILDDVAVIPE